MKIGYIAIFNEVTKSPAYHGFGYVKAHIGQLEDLGFIVDVLDYKSNLNDYEHLFIDEGVNWSFGSWNKIGGDFTKVITKLNALNDFTGNIYHNSIKPAPDYHDLIDKRKLDITLRPLQWKAIVFPKINLILGDSHCWSVYQKPWTVQSINGKTLHSFLNDQIRSYIQPWTERLRFYAGNIDIRFHFFRLNVDLQQMADELEKQLKDLNIDIELVQPLPIEDESRKMSSTMGSYKGKPFYGTQQQRAKIRQTWSDLLQAMCDRHQWRYLKWSDAISDSPNYLKISAMEPKRGPHLSPKFYMFN